MNTKRVATIPLLTRGVAPTAAVASSLLSPLALAASGDLDPSFADVGRLGPLSNFDGPAWSLEPSAAGDSIFAGGAEESCDAFYCYYDSEPSNFLRRLSGTGSTDLSFAAARLQDTDIYDVAVQPDGKVVAVGYTLLRGFEFAALRVFRLEETGALDPTFGDGGVFRGPGLGKLTSVALDDDGRIVVAGWQNDELIVLRLLANGVLDTSFGESGVFIGPANDSTAMRAHIVTTGDGRYRVTANDFSSSPSQCRVIGLTANGTLDNTFGTGGSVLLDTPSGGSATCSSLVAQANGRLVVAGSEDEQGFVIRLRANGDSDGSLSSSAVADTLQDATALAVGDDGSIFVAGHARDGVPGALIVRLQSDGELDELFGNAGRTWIDMPSDFGSTPVVHDLKVLSDGRVMAAGGDQSGPFVVRLLSESGGGSPGVLGMIPRISTTEEGQETIVTVRRTGGSAGDVSVGYQTRAGSDATSATGGQDFTQITGRLTWADGDVSNQEIHVPIASDTTSPEETEAFTLVLNDAQGGAGLGTRMASIEIRGDGDPAGQFVIEAASPSVPESIGVAQVYVYRNVAASGAVSVTLTPIGGTATPVDDFSSLPVTVSWSDGESGGRLAEFAIRNDATRERNEAFSVALSNPTGGAILGPRSTTSISIEDDEPPESSGGGRIGYLSLLFLSALGLLRFIRHRTGAAK